MKKFQILFLFCLLLGGLGLFACSAEPTATPIPPTNAPSIPTLVAPTIPPTVTPIATTLPTTTSADADQVARAALEKFAQAKIFRLDAYARVSPLFFQGEHTPAPGEDPNTVNIFTMKGAQNGADMNYSLGGFVASLIGVFSGFDPDSSALDIARVNDTLYMRGVLENETTAHWYVIPPDDAMTMRFAPQESLEPLTEATYANGAFSKSGTETLGGQACDVFSANRAAFDAVFPRLTTPALLNEETLRLENVERAEYKLVVCPDGKLYRAQYNFDAHAQDDATKKGTFVMQADISDYDASFAIAVPADAIPFPSTSASSPTRTPTTTITQTFTSLEGEWEGEDDNDSPLNFSVENNEIAFANVNFFTASGGCSFSTSIANSITDAPIQNSNFMFTLTNTDDVKFTVTGKFESNSAASGTLAVKGKTFCGDTDVVTTWTARHVSAPDTLPTFPTPAEIPTLTLPTVPAIATVPPVPTTAALPTGSGAIVQAVFDALSRNDVDGALAYFDTNVIYNIAGTSGIGTANLRSNLLLASSAGTTFQVSNIQELGGIVNFTVTVTGFGAGTYRNSSVILENGKIVILTVQ